MDLITKRKKAERRGAPHKWVKLIEEKYDEITAMASKGMIQSDIARVLGIPVTTFSAYKMVDQKLKDALALGKAKGINYVTGMFMKNIGAGNVKAQIFYLKTQAKWQERHIISIEDPLSTPDPSAPLSDEEAAKTYFDRMKQLRPEE